MTAITREEITQIQLEAREMKTKQERDSRDIKTLFSTTSEIKKSVDRGNWKVLGMVAVPVAILIFQLLNKGVQ